MKPLAVVRGGEGVQLGASDAVLTISCRVPSKWSRAPNITSLRMIKEWNQGSAQIYWHLHYSWGKSIKPQLADRLMKAIRPSSPQSLPLNDVGRTTQYIREGEGRKEEKDRVDGLSINRMSSTVQRAMGCGQKNLNANVAVPPAPVRVPSQWPLNLNLTSVTYFGW